MLLKHRVIKSFLFRPLVKVAKIGNIVIGSIATKIKTKFSRFPLLFILTFLATRFPIESFILKSKLAAYLNNSKGSYDYVLIDCPPSLSLLTVMALVCSRSLLVPLQTEFFALEGLTQLMKTIERKKVSLNPDLKIRGILLTMYDKRNKLSSQVEKEARDFFTEKVYSTVIPRNVRLTEAPSHGMPVLIYDKSCPGSKSYFSFTDEFINQESKIGSAA